MLRAFFSLFAKSNGPDGSAIEEVLDTLQKGEPPNLEKLLLQTTVADTPIDYLPITLSMLLKLKKPLESNERMLVYQQHKHGNYSLLILEIPWKDEAFKFTPLIVHNGTCKIAGIMGPFNELYGRLPQWDIRQIAKLSPIWIGFVIERKLL